MNSVSERPKVSAAARRIYHTLRSRSSHEAWAVRFQFDLDGQVLESQEHANIRPFPTPDVPTVSWSSADEVTVEYIQRWLDATRDAHTVENSPYLYVSVLAAQLVQLRDPEFLRTSNLSLAEEIELLRSVAEETDQW